MRPFKKYIVDKAEFLNHITLYDHIYILLL